MTSFEMIRPPSTENENDLQWLLPYLGISEEDRSKFHLKFESWDDSGGLSGANMRKVIMTRDGDDAAKRKFVYKAIPKTGLEFSAGLGLPREAFFYKFFADILMNELGITIAYPYYSFGSMETGEKVLLLEDLSRKGILSSFYFGPASPVNWNKDLPALIAQFPGETPTVKEVVSDVFKQVARMHRRYWSDSSLFAHSFLRSGDWFQGKGRESWENSQKMATDQWKKVKEQIASGKTSFEWNVELVAVVDASLAQISWDHYQDLLKRRSWTLVHGDFHPGNCYWIACEDETGQKGKTVLLDWEMVGLGNGPQELSQYMISHLEPATRRQVEDEVIHQYYEVLTAGEESEAKRVDPERYSFEQFRAEYVYGGFERWIWFLAALPAFCPEPMICYWHNQMVAFMQDHQITAESIGIPRV